MDQERAESLMRHKAAERDKKRNPKMRVTGRGMKRFAAPKRSKG